MYSYSCICTGHNGALSYDVGLDKVFSLY